jgi:hypothetical protein
VTAMNALNQARTAPAMSLVSLLLNLLWIVFGGLWMAAAFRNPPSRMTVPSKKPAISAQRGYAQSHDCDGNNHGQVVGTSIAAMSAATLLGI